MLLTFSGLDGAGKSTQIDYLQSWLSGNGYRSTILWARGGYTPGFEFLKRFVRLILRKKLPPPGRTSVRKEQLSNPLVVNVWLFLAMLDLMFYWGLYLRYKMLIGYIVICDRYLDDTRLDFQRNFPNVNFEKSSFWQLLCKFVPSASQSFLLWVPVDVSIRRGKLKNEPFPDDDETLQWRLKAYMDDCIFPAERYLKLDCTDSIDAVSRQIIASIKKTLNQVG